MSTSTTIKEVMRELAALEDPKMREANERRGDDHGVNLTHLRALAKRLKTQHELAVQLWATGDTAARLLATLVCRPKAFSAAELDAMICEIRSPKLLDWFIGRLCADTERLGPARLDHGHLVQAQCGGTQERTRDGVGARAEEAQAAMITKGTACSCAERDVIEY
jgi:DNA alkylation repair enzyme